MNANANLFILFNRFRLFKIGSNIIGFHFGFSLFAVHKTVNSLSVFVARL